MKHFGNFGRRFPAVPPQNPRSMYARVPQAMAQFVLEIEKLSHIIGTAPILEMARLRSPSPIMAPEVIENRGFKQIQKFLRPNALNNK